MARPESTRQIKSTRQIIRPGNQGGFFVAQKRLGVERERQSETHVFKVRIRLWDKSFNCLLLGL